MKRCAYRRAFSGFDRFLWDCVVGTTICYAFMQAVGIVNDHATDCFRYRICLKG